MATVAAMEILDRRDSMPDRTLSPLYLYYRSRRSASALGDVEIRDALAAAAEGVCVAAVHDPEMSGDGARLSPSAAAYEDAERQRLVAYDPNQGRQLYYRLGSSDPVGEVRSALAAGLPVLMGFWCTTAYWSGQGLMSVPHEASTNGHCAVVVASEGDGGPFWVLDSRGAGFGQQGCWPLAPAVLASRVVADLWTIERIHYQP